MPVFIVLSVTVFIVGYVFSLNFMDFISFLSMILKYNICSTWFLDITISTCSNIYFKKGALDSTYLCTRSFKQLDWWISEFISFLFQCMVAQPNNININNLHIQFKRECHCCFKAENNYTVISFKQSFSFVCSIGMTNVLIF